MSKRYSLSFFSIQFIFLALLAPSYSLAQEGTRLASKAAICSVILEVVAVSLKGTPDGLKVPRWSREFRQLALKEGMSAGKFYQTRDTLLTTFTTSIDAKEIVEKALNGCLVEAEKLGIIRD